MSSMAAPKIIMSIGALLLAALLFAGGCAVGPEDQEGAGEQSSNQEKEETTVSLSLTYYGQAAFLIEAEKKILVDPYRPELGYGKINLPADLVTVSHHHFDHDYAEGGQGAEALFGLNPAGEWQPVEKEPGFARIYSVNTYHDSQNGTWLGKNSVFVFEVAGLRLVHTGDLGHPLGENEIEHIGQADLLFIPVGGHYTLPYEAILQVIEGLKPAVVIPMHFRTKYYGDHNLGTLADFLNQDPPYPVCQKSSSITVSKEELPASTEIWTMEFQLP